MALKPACIREARLAGEKWGVWEVLSESVPLKRLMTIQHGDVDLPRAWFKKPRTCVLYQAYFPYHEYPVLNIIAGPKVGISAVAHKFEANG